MQRFINIGALASAKGRPGRWPRSAASIYRDIEAGLLPPPVKIGANAVAFPLEEVERIEAARIAGLPEPEIKAIVTKLRAARMQGVQA